MRAPWRRGSTATTPTATRSDGGPDSERFIPTPSVGRKHATAHALVPDGPGFRERVTTIGAGSGKSLEFDNVAATCYMSEHPVHVQNERNILKYNTNNRNLEGGGVPPARLSA